MLNHHNMKTAIKNILVDQECSENDDADIEKSTCNQQRSEDLFGLFQEIDNTPGGRMLFCF